MKDQNPFKKILSRYSRHIWCLIPFLPLPYLTSVRVKLPYLTSVRVPYLLYFEIQINGSERKRHPIVLEGCPVVQRENKPSAKEGEVNGGREAGHPVVLAGDVDAVLQRE